MPAEIPTLWPTEEISVPVVTPLAILRTQASSLSRLTRGLVEGEVVTVTTDTERDRLVQHQLEIVAPALGGYRRRLLSITHAYGEVYPVTVQDEVVGAEQIAYSQDQCIEAVRGILGSRVMLSVLQSLIARSTDEPSSVS